MQTSEIVGLKVKTIDLEAEDARLTAAVAAPPVSSTPSRRGLLPAGAAAAVLSVANDEPAHTGTRTTVFADNISSYGSAARLLGVKRHAS